MIASHPTENRRSTPLRLLWRRRRQSLPAPIITLLLIAVNVALFLWQIAQGADPWSPDLNTLSNWGANIGALTLTGDPWRLLSSMFLHIGTFHLLLNMLSLYFMGRIVELNFGRVNFALLYLLSGLGGSLVSALYHALPAASPDLAGLVPSAPSVITLTVSAGASGAIMGLAAAAIALRLIDSRSGRPTPYFFKGRDLFLLVVINMVYGWQTDGTDNACHVGGLLTGAVLGLILAACLHRRASRRAIVQAFVLVIGLVAVAYGVNSRVMDPELLQIREQLNAQQQRDDRLTEIGRERKNAVADAARDRAEQPAPVSAEQAAGIAIPLSAHAGNFVVGPSGKRAYVTDAVANTLTIVDIAGHTIVNIVSGGTPAAGQNVCRDAVCPGTGAAAVIVNGDETRAWVSSMRPNAIATIDLARAKLDGSIDVGHAPTRIVQSSNGQTAYVFNSKDDTISFVDLASGTQTGAPVPVYDIATAPPYPPGRSTSLIISRDGGRLYANSDSDSSVLVLDTASRAAIERITLSAPATDLALGDDDQTLSVLDSTGITQLDTQSFELQDEFHACNGMGDTAAFSFNADSSRVALWQQDARVTRIVKLSTHKTLGVYPAGSEPGKVQFADDGKHLLALYAGALHIQDLSKRVDVDSDSQADFFCWSNPEDAP
jgi:rhomboid protease GluP